MGTPRFSIVIPTYNRAYLVARAIKSVLQQDYRDFELIVVDDGSTDNSREVLEEFAQRDSRVRIIFHGKNQGVCPARNTGVNCAKGDWIIFLDSDHELLPGALSFIDSLLSRVSSDIARLNFVYLWDNGIFSPYPLPEAGIWDYRSYLRFWNEHLMLSDMLTCTRRDTFEKVRFPEGFALESIYHLDFARHYRQQFFPIALALEHTDASNRLTRSDFTGILKSAPYRLQELRQVLEKHGKDLAEHAPRAFAKVLRAMVSFTLIAEGRLKAWDCYRMYRKTSPFDPWFFGYFLMGTVFGPRFAYVIKTWFFSRRS